MDLSVVSTGLLIAIFLAIAVGALCKGLTGLGLPMFAVPAIAMLTSVEEAVVLLLIPGIVANVWLVISYRRYFELLKPHRPFLIIGFIGALIGTWLLQEIDDRILKTVLAVLLGYYLINQVLGKPAQRQLKVSSKGILGFFAGLLQGASGISAQIIAPYYHAQGVDKNSYAFLVAASFLTLSFAQLTAMLNLQLLTPDRLKLSFLILIPTVIFTWIGIRLAPKVSGPMLNKILLGLFFAMEIKLVLDIL